MHTRCGVLFPDDVTRLRVRQACPDAGAYLLIILIVIGVNPMQTT